MAKQAINQHKRMAMGDTSVAKDNMCSPMKMKEGGMASKSCGGAPSKKVGKARG